MDAYRRHLGVKTKHNYDVSVVTGEDEGLSDNNVMYDVNDDVISNVNGEVICDVNGDVMGDIDDDAMYDVNDDVMCDVNDDVDLDVYDLPYLTRARLRRFPMCSYLPFLPSHDEKCKIKTFGCCTRKTNENGTKLPHVVK